jgi:hypothetical protein
MNRIFATSIVLMTAVLHADPAVEPAKLVKLRQQYQADVARVSAPLQWGHIAELEKLKSAYTKEAKLDEAVAVDKALKKLQPAPSASGAAPAASSDKKLSKEDAGVIQAYFVGRTWVFPGDKGAICHFNEDGTGVSQSANGGQKSDTVRWRLDESGVLIIDGFGTHKKLTFKSPALAEVDYYSKETGKVWQTTVAEVSPKMIDAP